MHEQKRGDTSYLYPAFGAANDPTMGP